MDEDERRRRLQYMRDLDASAIENICGKVDRWHFEKCKPGDLETLLSMRCPVRSVKRNCRWR